MATTDIQYKTLDQLVQLQLNYISANAPTTLTLPLGPFITAICYATGLVALVIQRLGQLILKAARLSTSTGDDVDSFIADYGLSRLPGVKARGEVTFSTFSPATSSIFIPNGVLVQTSAKPAIQFQVVADTTQPAYSSSDGGYYLLAGSTSADTSVEALEIGSNANIGAGQINSIASSVSGIDTCVNGAAFTTGSDAETDEELRIKFIHYIQGLSKATPIAIASALDGLQSGLSYSIVEFNGPNATPNGVVEVHIDDGTGSAGPLVAAASAAVGRVRPAGVRVDLTAASPLTLGICARVDIDKAITPDILILRKILRNSLAAGINSNHAPGETFHYSNIYRYLFNAISPGDAVSTEIIFSPPSTNSVLQVLSTEGLAVGQMVEVTGFTTLSGLLPTVKSIDGTNQFTLASPLTAAPIAGTLVEGFTIKPKQIRDIHSVVLQGTVQAVTTIKASPVSTSTDFYCTSVTGMSSGVIIITDESDPLNPISYQNAPGQLELLSYTGVDVPNSKISVTAENKVGIIAADGTWTETAPPAGATVVTMSSTSNSNGMGDVIPTASQVTRARLAGANHVFLKLEPI